MSESTEFITVPPRIPNVILFGTGEYTTGYVDGAPSTSDKPMGVIALTFFDLRARGLVGKKITLCGRSGSRAVGIRQHLSDTIHRSYGLDVSCNIYPYDPTVSDPLAYLHVLNSGEYIAGDLAVVTTPDDTHATIALECIKRGIHVIIAKPVVQSLEEHWKLIEAAETYRSSPAAKEIQKAGGTPLVTVGEFHKRFDPIYSDAIEKIHSGSLGSLSYAHAYMSQPKSQLKTFQSWLVSGANTSGHARPAPSDISFYLNSHHIDLVNLSLWESSRPVWVQAISAKGYANEHFNTTEATVDSTAATTSAETNGETQSNGTHTDHNGREVSAPKRRKVDIEDTITVTVQYAHGTTAESAASSFGIAVFTSSWIAPRSDVHSQQRLHFLGTQGEIHVDQAHRGYNFAMDSNTKGFQSGNPLFMRYQPSHEGKFVGQQGYGYKSFEHFVESLRGLPSTAITPHSHLASHASLFTTAILQAARRSLDEDNRKVHILYDQQRRPLQIK